jgi:putative membrane-bound dehydrogenase-like protein
MRWSIRPWVFLVGVLFAADLTLAQGLAPEEAARRMRVTEAFEVKGVAAEPLVRQPVCIEFDDRGRLWVIQYLQYPNPAELKRVQVDRYSRTKYDRVPEPPPRGPRGADRITILTDSNGDGVMDRGRDFVEGLNLTSGLAFGHGGVFVLNVPYLLFYPDGNRDDVPDGDPEVLLTGFGMEDAHSVANSLTWGPDGWLYGCQGSTVTANIRGIEFQQGVWRYHPVTRAFELFCEGGGNSWGLDFDRIGRLLYSTNYGGHVLLHGVQGGYFVKSFAKHGALHNAHTYGYFDHAPHRDFRGGHVTVGGIVYQADSFPAAFRGKYIAGDLLGHGVYWHHIDPHGSTVKTAHAGELLLANDAWFAPTDVVLGPDGAVYVSDWHDARTAHPDPDAEWDRSNGRIYRIAPTGSPSPPKFDLATQSTEQLLNLLRHPNQWHVRRARQELVRRRDGSVKPVLRKQAIEAQDEVASLEALWTLASLGDFDESLAETLLTSPHPAVRSWSVRLLGDSRQVTTEMAHRLDELAERESDVSVRQQLACTAARLPAAQALPIINAHINRDIDDDDPYVPLLWWWAVERHSLTGREEVLRRFTRATLWKSRLGREVLLTRLIRRYAAEASPQGWESVERLLRAAPDDAARDALWPHVLLGCRDTPRKRAEVQMDVQTVTASHPGLSQLVLARWRTATENSTLLQLGLLFGLREPFETAMHEAMNPSTSLARRAELLSLLAETGDLALIEPLLAIVAADAPDAVRLMALSALARFDDPHLAPKLIALHGSSTSTAVKSQIRDVLLGRKTFASQWLKAIDRGEIPATMTPLEQVRRVALLDDAELDGLVAKHWGRLQGSTREEKLAEVRRLNNDLRAAVGDPMAGQGLFTKHCANCHQLFGQGNIRKILGPDLTTANRADREFLLISLVDPSSVIRKEFVSVVIQTNDGRTLTGFPIARNGTGVTLVNANNEQSAIAASDIAEIADSPVSLMPEELYRQLRPQELRDLFAYLQLKAPQ